MSRLLSPSTTQTIFAPHLLILKTACFAHTVHVCVFIVTKNGDDFLSKFTKPSTAFLCHTLKNNPLSHHFTVALTWLTCTRMENRQCLGSFNTVIKSGGTPVLSVVSYHYQPPPTYSSVSASDIDILVLPQMISSVFNVKVPFKMFAH
jgi:hypothetical protein